MCIRRFRRLGKQIVSRLSVPDTHGDLRFQVELRSVVAALRPELIPLQLPNVELSDQYDHTHSHVLHADVIVIQTVSFNTTMIFNRNSSYLR
jgi:hypothetical protein